jgi:hypothetical protein
MHMKTIKRIAVEFMISTDSFKSVGSRIKTRKRHTDGAGVLAPDRAEL